MPWPDGNNVLLHAEQSPYQSIKFYRCNNDFWLSLNNVLQFHTDECYKSHKYMVRIPAWMFKKRTGSLPKKALIIGGGDGFAAMEFLNILPNTDLTQIELDANLLNFSKNHPVMRILNRNSFHHPNLKLMAGDGLDFLIKTPQTFDIIIDDCDVEVTNQPTAFKKRYKKYQRALIDKLNPGGVACVMEPLVATTPGAYKNVPRSPLDRRNWIANQVAENEDLKEWKQRIPKTQYAVADLPHIGPELYIYMPKP
jgi:predicted membrane-bound spermidine synthase